MRVRTQIALLVAGLGSLVAASASLGDAIHERSEDQDTVAVRDLREAAALASSLGLGFKTQVQEWKNVLLRGADPADFAAYWRRFEREESEVEETARRLSEILGGEPDLRARVPALQTEHARLGDAYRAAAEIFQTVGERDPRVADARVRGIDRSLAQGIESLLGQLRVRLDERRAEAAGHGRSVGRAAIATTTVIILLSLLVFLYCLDRWLSRPLSSARASAEAIARGHLDEPVAPAGCGEMRDLLVALEEMRGELRRTGAELRATRDRALASSRAKATFLATMSHEIRTPMNGVVGMLQLLRDKPLDPEGREFVQVAASSADDLLRLLDDILDVSKIESGRLELERIAFDPGRCAEDVTQLLSATASRKGVELVCLVKSGVPARLRGDSARIRQVISNLVSNAIKFTEAGGSVMVELSARPRGEKEALLRCEVQDTGIGIAKEERERLFQPFQQADSSTTRRFGGTGLGLTICRSLVEMMGGEIGMTSTPGRGSTFRFTVPLPVVDPAPDPPRRLAKLAGRRVLVADDNAANRRMLEYQLSRWGMETTVVRDGRSALEAVRAAARDERPPFHLILLDYVLPEENGLDVARALVDDPALRGARLVVLASVRERAALAAAEEIGIDAYLTKPVRFQQLEECLQVVLGQAPAATTPVLTETTLSETRVRARHRVLLVEDVDVNRRVAKRMLEGLGCRVDVAENGRDALAAWDGVHYDLVFMDWRMPVMDGFTATQQLRRIERERGLVPTPIVALTANASPEDRERCLAGGMDDHVAKPIRREELLRVLTRWLPAAPLPAASGAGAVPDAPLRPSP